MKYLSLALLLLTSWVQAAQLMMSTSPDRSNPVALDGATNLVGNIYVFTSPDTGITQVRYYLDDPTAAGTPYATESRAPFDLAGTNSDNTAKPFDTIKLTPGIHTITQQVDLSSGITETDIAFFELPSGTLFEAIVGEPIDLACTPPIAYADGEPIPDGTALEYRWYESSNGTAKVRFGTTTQCNTTFTPTVAGDLEIFVTATEVGRGESTYSIPKVFAVTELQMPDKPTKLRVVVPTVQP